MESNPVDPAGLRPAEPGPEPGHEPLPPFAAESLTEPPPQPVSTVPEDLRVPWDFVDVLLLVVFGIGSIFLAALGVQVLFSFLLPTMNAGVRNNLFVIVLQVVWSLVIVGYLALFLRLRSRETFWRTIGFRAYRSGELSPALTYVGTVVSGALLAIGVSLIGGLMEQFVKRPENMPIEQMFQARESAVLMMCAAILVAPFAEEILFRGFLYPVLARRLGVALGILITGALFGLMHAGQLRNAWVQVSLLMMVGWVMTYVRARTGSVLASYLLHLGYNALLLLGFYFATSGLKNLPTPK